MRFRAVLLWRVAMQRYWFNLSPDSRHASAAKNAEGVRASGAGGVNQARQDCAQVEPAIEAVL
jgi:hypothetical protein